MKKILSIGIIPVVTMPIASVIACSTEHDVNSKITLDWKKFDDNESRYLDETKNKLMWENIIEDGFSVIDLPVRRYPTIGGTIGRVKDKYLFSNTEMNIPEEIISIRETFSGRTINKKIVLGKKLMEASFSEKWLGGMFMFSEINSGIQLSNDVEYIPFQFLSHAKFNLGSLDNISILPDSLIEIDKWAYINVDSRVLSQGTGNLTLSHMRNLETIGSSSFEITSDYDSYHTIYLPPNLSFDKYSGWNDGPFGMGWLHPKKVVYYFEDELTIQDKELFFKHNHQKIEWSKLEK